jgi:hypothetical protein
MGSATRRCGIWDDVVLGVAKPWRRAKPAAESAQRDLSRVHPSDRGEATARRARREQQQAQGMPPAAVGAVVPWPMPPELVIRQTPDVYSEITALLSALRR